jgi:hypothetical protein
MTARFYARRPPRGDDWRLLFSIGVIFFIWFLSSLRTRMLAAEGPAGRLAGRSRCAEQQ